MAVVRDGCRRIGPKRGIGVDPVEHYRCSYDLADWLRADWLSAGRRPSKDDSRHGLSRSAGLSCICQPHDLFELGVIVLDRVLRAGKSIRLVRS